MTHAARSPITMPHQNGRPHATTLSASPYAPMAANAAWPKLSRPVYPNWRFRPIAPRA